MIPHYSICAFLRQYPDKPNMTMRVGRSILLFLLLTTQLLFSQTFPAGFSQVRILPITDASAMAFAPDGRLFICRKSGEVRIVKNGSLLPDPFLTVTVDVNGERGLGAIAFDPDFTTNHYVYIYYTATTPTLHNRLSRFTANGDVVAPGSELALLDGETVTSVFHNGGGLGFGPDGKLYLAMGEDNKPGNAQNLEVYKGKVLRINPDGSAPSDNPYSSSTNEVTKRIWATGNRNPYTLAFQPGTGKLFINNVGADNYEEIHDATEPGKNFGWPAVEGNSSNPAYDNPVFAYPHEGTGQYGCCISGGVFFNPESTSYPSEYTGKYFYMEFCNGWIYYLTLGSTVTNTFFSSGMSTQNLALQLGPDGNLYYIKRYNDFGAAGIYKIIYTNNSAPTITSNPSNVTVIEGQTASFNVSASGATPLGYQWKKNGTTISGANSSTYTIPVTAKADSGKYSVTVSNSFGSATSDNAKLTVSDFNEPPTASITSPSGTPYYHGGEVISFSGTAADPEDGTLNAGAFEWEVEFHHNNNHFHPGPVIPPGIQSGSFTIPNTGEPSSNVFYRLKLKVTDSSGLMDTAHIDILPLTAVITINTEPAFLQITFDSQNKPTPFTYTAVQGLQVPVGVVSPQSRNGQAYTFDHWENGAPKNQVIQVGAGDSSYTATFKDTVIFCSASGKILREHWSGVQGDNLSSVDFTGTPTSTSYPVMLEAPIDIEDSYAARMRGYICAPMTGNYTFWIASDNNSELWLSTNNDPINKQKIAGVAGWTDLHEWTKYPSQQSAPVYLLEGGKYYLEVLHKEDNMGDHVSVGWQLPDAYMERPIPGERLSQYVTPQECGIPNGLATTSVTPTSVVLSWNTVVNASGYEVRYKESTKINWTLTTALTNSKQLPGLKSYTMYDFQVKTICDAVTGGFSITEMFTTLPEPVFYSQNLTICYGQEALVGPHTYSISGTYTDTLTMQNGADSTVTTHLTVKESIDKTVTVAGPVLKAHKSEAVYQWVDCGNGMALIPGETAQTFTPSVSGNYAVIITFNGCKETSDCNNVVINGIPNILQAANLSVFPNPTDNTIYISYISNEPESNLKVSIKNETGQVIYETGNLSFREEYKSAIDLGRQAKGVYFMEVISGEEKHVKKLILK